MYFALTSYYSLCYLLNAGNSTYRLLAMEAIAKQCKHNGRGSAEKKSLQNSLNAFLHSSYQVEKLLYNGIKYITFRFLRLVHAVLVQQVKWFHAVK